MSVGEGRRFPSCGKRPEAVAGFKGLSGHVGLGGLSVSLQGGTAPAVFGRSEPQGRQERLSEEVAERESFGCYCRAWCHGCGPGASVCF